MKPAIDLVGKTISGIVAAPAGDDHTLCIWMLQFTDGSHVEFVSPAARRALQGLAGRRRGNRHPTLSTPQLALNVA